MMPTSGPVTNANRRDLTIAILCLPPPRRQHRNQTFALDGVPVDHTHASKGSTGWPRADPVPPRWRPLGSAAIC
jgi:hypothetical protein